MRFYNIEVRQKKLGILKDIRLERQNRGPGIGNMVIFMD